MAKYGLLSDKPFIMFQKMFRCHFLLQMSVWCQFKPVEIRRMMVSGVYKSTKAKLQTFHKYFCSFIFML